jgi:hypothetical protein
MGPDIYIGFSPALHLQCGSSFRELFREEGEEVRAAYLMVKSSTEEELTSVQQFMEALQFAGKFFERFPFCSARDWE